MDLWSFGFPSEAAEPGAERVGHLQRLRALLGGSDGHGGVEQVRDPALVDRAGLKGAASGGAVVSPLHANFIVVAPGSRATDVRTLIERCRDAVATASGVYLDDEIVYLGAWDGSRESES